MSQLKLETISYYMDWDLETWQRNNLTSSYVISTMCSVSEEVRDAYQLSLTTRSSTTFHSQHNVVKFVLQFTLREEDITYLMLKYPTNKRVIPIDNSGE